VKFTDALRKTVATVAPTIGVALGGPLGGIAGQLIAKAVGKEGAPEEEIEAALLTATPETMLALKQADVEFQKFLKDADIKLAALDNEDRDSARARHVQVKDRTPAVLAAAVTIGFFGVLIWMMAYGLPITGQDALLVMLGSLGTSWAGIIAFYFGSSSSSRSKDATISAAMKK
jgi:hypothetical protein